jgi:hypothetical protein
VGQGQQQFRCKEDGEQRSNLLIAKIFITKQDVGCLSARLLIPMYFLVGFLIFIPLFLPLHVGFPDLYSITGYMFSHDTLIYLFIVLFLFTFCFLLFYSTSLLLCSIASVFFISLSSSYISFIFSYSTSFILFPVRFIIPRIFFPPSLIYLVPLFIFSFLTSAKFSPLFSYCSFLSMPGSSVGIATGYGRDGPGIESRWGWHFPHLSRPALGPTQPPVQRAPSLSRG